MTGIVRFFHHHLIPSNRNNYRAKALHLDFLTMLLVLAVVFSFAAPKAQILGIATDVNIDRLLQKTNEIRASKGLQPLSYNNTLANAAQNKAQHMFANNYWDHFAPDGTSPWDFITRAGYSYQFAGENLAYNFMFSDDVVNAWMDSATHRANIERAEYTEIGFAVMNGTLIGEETTLVVQMFGTPNQVTALTENTEQTTNSFVPPAEAQEIEPVESAPNENPTHAQEKTETPISETIQVGNDKQVIISSASAPAALTSPSQKMPFSINSLTFNTSTLILVALLGVLFLDLVIAMRLKMLRITSKNLAHFLFLGAILIGAYIVKNGAIL